MYMPGRLRTASSPSSTWICPAEYSRSGASIVFAISVLKECRVYRRGAEAAVPVNLTNVTARRPGRNSRSVAQLLSHQPLAGRIDDTLETAPGGPLPTDFPHRRATRVAIERLEQLGLHERQLRHPGVRADGHEQRAVRRDQEGGGHRRDLL